MRVAISSPFLGVAARALLTARSCSVYLRGGQLYTVPHQ